MTQFNTALSYEYLTSFNNVELMEVEALCLATQDTASLARIARIREWRAAENRTSVAGSSADRRTHDVNRSSDTCDQASTLEEAGAQIAIAQYELEAAGFPSQYLL